MAAIGLWAVDEFGLLGAGPVYTATAAGQVKDEATYWAAQFAFNRRNLWVLVVRGIVFSLAYLCLIPLMLAVNALTGSRRARVQVAGGLFAAAAVFGVLYGIIWLAACEYWRGTGWENVPPEVMLTVGRQTQALIGLSNMASNASLATFAVGLVHLGAACWSEERLPRWLAPVAWVGGVCSMAAVVLSEVPGAFLAYGILGLLAGALVAPLMTIGLGVHLGRGVRQRSA